MPQTIQSITITLAEAPTGILRDMVEPRHEEILGQVQSRLDYAKGALYMLKSGEDISPAMFNAIGAIETLIEDTSALLTVIPMRGVA